MNPDTKHRIERLEEYLRNSSSKADQAHISKEALYSYRHANRIFTSLKGESILSYSQKIRLSFAAEYLKFTSRPIFDIAVDCGYESTAALSKAFKKLYGATPSHFRKQHNRYDLLKSINLSYTFQAYDGLEVQTCQVRIPSGSDLVGFYQQTKAILYTLNPLPKTWILLWNEDPKLTQVSEIVYSLGFYPEVCPAKHPQSRSMSLEGRYAVFMADALKQFPYENWHEILCAVLSADGKELRLAPYIEFFSDSSLQDAQSFHPDKIAVPIV